MSQLSHLLPGRPGQIPIGSVGVINTTTADYTDQYGAKWLRMGFWAPYDSIKYGALSPFSSVKVSKFDVYLNVTPSTNMLDVAYTGSEFIAVNNQLQSYQSADGITWVARTPPTKLPSLVSYGLYAGGKWVIPAQAPACSLDNGVTWNVFGLPVGLDWRDIAYGAGLYVLINYTNGTVYTSSDALNWTARTNQLYIAQNVQLYYTGTVFVCRVSGQLTYAYKSTDGITWTQLASPLYSNVSDTMAVNGNTFCFARGDASSNVVRYSTNAGTSWANGTLPATKSWYGSAYGGGYYVHISDDTAVYSTSPGSGYTSVAFTGPSVVTIGYTFEYVNGNFMLASGGTQTSIPYSPTGAVWTYWAINSGAWGCICYGNGVYLVVDRTARSYATATTLGGTWTYRDFPFKLRAINLVRFVNGQFIVAEANGILLAKSTDGITWTEVTPKAALKAVASNGTNFVGVSGNSGYAAVSADGLSWQDVTCGGDFQCIAYGDGKYVIAAYNATTSAYSADGITWSAGPRLPSRLWGFMAYGNGVFVVIPYSSTSYATSTDGITWTDRTGLPGTVFGIEFVNDRFIAWYSSTTVAYTSTNGIDWVTEEMAASGANLSGGFAYGAGKYVGLSGYCALVTDFSTPKNISFGASAYVNSIPTFVRYW